MAAPSDSAVLDGQGGREAEWAGDALLPKKREEAATVAGCARGVEAPPLSLRTSERERGLCECRRGVALRRSLCPQDEGPRRSRRPSAAPSLAWEGGGLLPLLSPSSTPPTVTKSSLLLFVSGGAWGFLGISKGEESDHSSSGPPILRGELEGHSPRQWKTTDWEASFFWGLEWRPLKRAVVEGQQGGQEAEVGKTRPREWGQVLAA